MDRRTAMAPERKRELAMKILEHPNPHPKNVEIARHALRLAKIADKLPVTDVSD